jgi:hypothetical protein
MTTRSCRAFALTLMASVAASARVAAADSSAQDSAAAQSLYDEARRLTSAGKWADACPKLEESQRLDPTPVTEFYLADCYEHAGRTASAWSTFLDLAVTAHRSGGPRAADRERVAKERAAALEPRLARLQIDVVPAVRVQGLVVKRDGELVGEGQWGAPVAVDPGKHAIEASAPGKKPWTLQEDVPSGGRVVTLQVPALEDAPAPVATSAPPSPAPAADDAHGTGGSGSSALKTVGIVTAGVGVAGLVAGAVLGLTALSKNSDANNGHCGGSANFPDANACDQLGIQLRHDAVNDGNLATVAFVAGGVVFATGAGIWLLAPSAQVQAAPSVGAGSAGLVVRGKF